LSLEAAVQIDPMDATSWKNLGLRQQENENEGAAINALRKAIELDPTLLDSHIALAVSYTNESMFSEAYKALEGWLANNPQYSHLLSQQPATNFNHHEHLTATFLAAARLSSATSFDAGPQMALGVLFNISGDHAKAMDCFQSCLASHPQDYQLWNKLGATLANSKDPSRALEAYTRALQLNPDFLRARYNVAIAYLQLGKYADAVRHLVAILECQEMNMHSMASGSTWNTLWMVMDRYLNRPDLAKAADEKNLNVFRNLDFLSTGYEEGPYYA
ncbi:TPR-like protein, partial [Rhizoclosmatium globosum]